MMLTYGWFDVKSVGFLRYMIGNSNEGTKFFRCRFGDLLFVGLSIQHLKAFESSSWWLHILVRGMVLDQYCRFEESMATSCKEWEGKLLNPLDFLCIHWYPHVFHYQLQISILQHSMEIVIILYLLLHHLWILLKNLISSMKMWSWNVCTFYENGCKEMALQSQSKGHILIL